MEHANRSGLLEDNRFKTVPSFAKLEVPKQLHWFLKDDYFTDEMVGFYSSEAEGFKRAASQAYEVFGLATAKILKDKNLHLLGIPSFFEECVYYSWENRAKHPFFLGRFDINGGIDNTPCAVIEFNADTLSSIPETMYWQALQSEKLKGGFGSFSHLQSQISESLRSISYQLGNPAPVLLASSFGYKEDFLNSAAILDVAAKLGFESYYQNLEEVVFSEEGIFYHSGEEYIRADIWYKMIPWDWMFNDEPELARIMSNIILQDLAVVLNPAYTTIWQNKLFLAYITENFPGSVIAETYTTGRSSLNSFVKKPVYGRIGENILLRDQSGKEFSSGGDYGNQKMVFQKYCPLPKDSDDNYFQVGVFYGLQPCAINVREQDSKIMTDDCGFISHYIIP